MRSGGSAGKVRFGVWVLHMALPALALWLLISQPSLDVTWEHHPSHFWLVAGVAAINVALSLRVLSASRQRRDARLLLVGYALAIAAGFLGLHALATPGVLLSSANGGFEIATPFGLSVASLLFFAASVDYRTAATQKIVKLDSVFRASTVLLVTTWAVVSLAGLPPLAAPLTEEATGAMTWVALVAIALYLLSAALFLRSHKKRRSVMLIALITASVLLAEAMATIIGARSWQLSWWLWHVLMAAAFGFIGYSAHSQYQKEGGSSGVFDGIVSSATAAELREQYGGALEGLTDAFQRSVDAGLSESDIDLIVTGLTHKLDLTDSQADILGRAAQSLASERTQARRLGALALIGTAFDVEEDDREMLDRIVEIIGPRFSPDVVKIGLLRGETIHHRPALASGEWPDEANEHKVPIAVRDRVFGEVAFARVSGTFTDRDTAIHETLAAELGIALENARLYAQLDSLFRTYLSPTVADTLRSDPSKAELGGSRVVLTALFADLRGFTSYSEETDPAVVMEMLNSYFSTAVPVILRHGGTVIQFVGDALLAVFDAPTPLPDHELRAARAALEMQTKIAAVASDIDGAPLFRIGINTGTALIGNVGGSEVRSFTVVGDAINVASRLETSAEPGQVVVGEATLRKIEEHVKARALGPLILKGKSQPLNAFVLEELV